MNIEQLTQIMLGVGDKLVGPVLDELGTSRISTGLTSWDIVDRQTDEVIGKSREIAGDGLVFIDDYYERSTLRNRFFGEK